MNCWSAIRAPFLALRDFLWPRCPYCELPLSDRKEPHCTCLQWLAANNAFSPGAYDVPSPPPPPGIRRFMELMMRRSKARRPGEARPGFGDDFIYNHPVAGEINVTKLARDDARMQELFSEDGRPLPEGTRDEIDEKQGRAWFEDDVALIKAYRAELDKGHRPPNALPDILARRWKGRGRR